MTRRVFLLLIVGVFWIASCPGRRETAGIQANDTLSDAELAQAVKDARAKVAHIDAKAHPREYLLAFDAALRPTIEKDLGEKLPPLPIDWSNATTRMYLNQVARVQKSTDVYTYRGSPERAKPMIEAVWLPASGQPCTGIVIALNALVTARHCSVGAPTRFTVIAEDGTATHVDIDPARFEPLKTPDGSALDADLLIASTNFPGVTEQNLPVFASDAMIAGAAMLHIVGFGGDTSDSLNIGVKRLGEVPIASSACSEPEIITRFQCEAGFEIVGGAQPLADRRSCPKSTDTNPVGGPCLGDSGGPAYIPVGNKLFLAGIIRKFDDRGCGCADTVNVYVRLDKHLPRLRCNQNIEFGASSFAAVGAPPDCTALGFT